MRVRQSADAHGLTIKLAKPFNSPNWLARCVMTCGIHTPMWREGESVGMKIMLN